MWGGEDFEGDYVACRVIGCGLWVTNEGEREMKGVMSTRTIFPFPPIPHEPLAVLRYLQRVPQDRHAPWARRGSESFLGCPGSEKERPIVTCLQPYKESKDNGENRKPSPEGKWEHRKRAEEGGRDRGC